METKEVYGFRHLVGQTVYVVADGALEGCGAENNTYTDKTIQTVSASGSVLVHYRFYGTVRIGMAYTAQISTLPVSFEAAAASRGSVKNISKVYARMNGAGNINAGPTTGKLVSVMVPTTETGEMPPMVEVPILGDWNSNGGLVITHADPEPFMLQSIVLEVTTGG